VLNKIVCWLKGHDDRLVKFPEQNELWVECDRCGRESKGIKIKGEETENNG
jgi:hypothetical protein